MLGYNRDVSIKALKKVNNQSLDAALDAAEPLQKELRKALAKKTKTKVLKNQWSCEVCTFKNNGLNGHVYCEMC